MTEIPVTQMPIKTPPSPKGHFLLGSLPDYRKAPMAYEKYLHQTHGDVVHVHVLNRHIYLVANPDDIRQVLVEDADKFIKAPVYRTLLSRFLGNGLLTSEGDFWRRQRKLSQPAFHHKRIQAYAQTMVDYTQQMIQEWQNGQVHDVNHDMMRLTLSIVAKTLFNADVNDSANRVGDALTVLLEVTNERTRSLIQAIPEWLPTEANRQAGKAVRDLDEIVMGIIEQRRKSGEDTGDLLSMLLIAEDDDGKHMTDKQLRDEAVTLVLAGHETTANALAWTWYLLSQNPEVEAKLHAELDRVLGGRAPTLEDLRHLEYTDQVIKESMRLYPPIPTFARQAKEDITIGGFFAPKGTIISISPHIVHRDPRWYPEPDTFQPQRFSKENEKLLPKYAYIPFGGGPRICIGNTFAAMEASLLLATMAQHYRLKLMPGQDVVPEPTLTLRPKTNIMMQVEERQPEAALA